MVDMASPDYLQGIICPQVGAPLQVNFTPRQYQLELLEASLKRNSVICLQSGSAKDFIAIMLIKELSKHVRKSCSDILMFTVFVVNTAKLVTHQANIIKTHTNLKVAEYPKELDREFEAQKFWEIERESYQVVVLTCRFFLHLLSKGVMKLSVINAVIFDECHHALEEHPYHDIMSLFDECSPDEQPHILGLTSSLLVGKFLPMALEKILNDLECTLKSNIETAINVQSVSRYGTKPKEIVIECEPYEHLTVCCNELMNVLNETLCNLERYRSDTSAEEDEDPTLLPRQAIQESIRALNGIGPLGLKLMVQLLLSEIEKFEKHATSPFNKLLFTYTCSQLRYVRKKCSLECGLHLKEGESIWSLRLVAPNLGN
ncbi:putative endoribonuclease Dicer-like [Apostichopus japonicus]|uniref:Putative endoribonuclease Dicer-like n=1 Tax=Stichopus japonicus TaxID=307972 RepID=A0A2G8JS37_STIJA|nr:putative endoribonuclease Dicer-like [Apostichopus japonicus]